MKNPIKSKEKLQKPKEKKIQKSRQQKLQKLTTRKKILVQLKKLQKTDDKKIKSKKTFLEIHKKVIEIRRVCKVGKGGKKFSFRALVVIGNQNGLVGVGIGKANEVINAIEKGKNYAKKNMIKVPLTITKTIPYLVKGFQGACNVLLKPASPGTGVIAGGSLRIVLELAGIKNILTKQLGSNNLLNNALSTIKALKTLDYVNIKSSTTFS